MGVLCHIFYGFMVLSFTALARPVVENSPSDLEEAQSAFDQGEYKNALDLILHLVPKYSQNPKLKILLAKTYARLGNYRTSYELFRKLRPKVIAPNFAFEFGVASYHQGFCRRAISAFKLVPEGRQDRESARVYIGLCYSKQREWQRAERLLMRSVTHDEDVEALRIGALSKVRRALSKSQTKNSQTFQKPKKKDAKTWSQPSSADLVLVPTRAFVLEGGYDSTKIRYLSPMSSDFESKYSRLRLELMQLFSDEPGRHVDYYFGGSAFAKRAWEQELSSFLGFPEEPVFPRKFFYDHQGGEGRLGWSFFQSSLGSLGGSYEVLQPFDRENPGYQSQKYFGQWEILSEGISPKIVVSQENLTARNSSLEKGTFENNTRFHSGLIKRTLEGTLTFLPSEYSGELYGSFTQSQTAQPLVDPIFVNLDNFDGEIYETRGYFKRHWISRSVRVEGLITRYMLQLLRTSKLEEETRLGVLLEWSEEFPWAGILNLGMGQDSLLGYRVFVQGKGNEMDILTTNGRITRGKLTYLQPLWGILDGELTLQNDNYQWPTVDGRYRDAFEDQVPKAVLMTLMRLQINIEF